MTSIAENISDTKIRFSNFTEPFKEYRLGDITETISRPIKMEDEKDYLLVTVKRRNEGIVERGIYKGKEVKVKSQFKIDAGDFLISKRQIIHGACEVVPNNMAGAIVSNEYHILHGKKELLLTEYLNLLSKTPKLKNYFALACVGVDIEKMLFRIEDWKKRVVKIPSIEEQRKIVDFFNLFNRKLVKQQEKIEKLEQFKKGMMQKVFSQELRFKDEDDGEFPEWEEKELEKCLNIENGFPFKSSYFTTEKLGMPLLRIRDIKAEKLNTYYTGDFDEKYLVDNQDIVIGMDGEFAVSKWNKGPALLNQRVMRIKSKEDNSLSYLYQLLKIVVQKIEDITPQTTVKHLSNKDIFNSIVKMPSFDEQQKIGNFFLEIDTKIEKEKEKLMVLEEQKRGFMQMMFN